MPRYLWYAVFLDMRLHLQDAAVNDAVISAPAFRQALYLQQLVPASVSRYESMELASQSLSETSQQQQVRCTAINALLQLSPVLAEEVSPGQDAADVLINCCLLPGNDVTPRGCEDLDEAARELRQLCLLALLALSPQPQSMASLLTLSPELSGSSAVSVHDSQPSNPSGHALVFWLDNRMLTGSKLKQVN